MSIVAETPATEIPDRNVVDRPGLVGARVRGQEDRAHPRQGACARASPERFEGGEQPSIEGTADAASITTFDETRDSASAVAGLLRRRALSRAPLRVDSRSSIDGDELVVHGRSHDQGRRRSPSSSEVASSETETDPTGNERIALELDGTIDRTDFGLNWNTPLPGGGFLLPNEVSPEGDLRGGKGRLSMRILAISGSLRADSYNTALARAAVELAPTGRRRGALRGSRLRSPLRRD